MLRESRRTATHRTRSGKPGDEAISGAHEKVENTCALQETDGDRRVPAPVGERGKELEAVFRARCSEGGDGSAVGSVSLQHGPVDAPPAGIGERLNLPTARKGYRKALANAVNP